jgi:hypothetical protein
MLLFKCLSVQSPTILSVNAVQSEILMLLKNNPLKETLPWLTVVTCLCWLNSETAVNNFFNYCPGRVCNWCTIKWVLEYCEHPWRTWILCCSALDHGKPSSFCLVICFSSLAENVLILYHIVSFIFIPQNCTGVQNPYGYGSGHIGLRSE